jgi:predicted ATPase
VNPLFLQKIRIDWDSVDPDSYLNGIPAIRSMEELTFHAPVTFFAGENGSGKSTLLEAVAVASGFNPEGGTRNYRFGTRDTHSELNESIRMVRGYRKIPWGYFFRAESFYNVATQEEEYGRESGRSSGYHLRSHGQSFLALAENSLAKEGLYFLDEPEAALSPQRQMSFLVQLKRSVQAGSQFIIATHSPILLAYPGAEILSFDGGTIHPCTYEDTDSYQLMRMFLDHRTRMLEQLLGIDEF